MSQEEKDWDGQDMRAGYFPRLFSLVSTSFGTGCAEHFDRFMSIIHRILYRTFIICE